jgi:23S rRNA (uridine2552-2'-O)-methyltransferase
VNSSQNSKKGYHGFTDSSLTIPVSLFLASRFRFFGRGQVVVDLGAAPGGWSLVAAQRVAAPQSGRVVGVDLLPSKFELFCHIPPCLLLNGHAVDPSPLFTSIIGDFTDASTCMQLKDACGGGCNVVLCDAAPNSSGQQWCAST